MDSSQSTANSQSHFKATGTFALFPTIVPSREDLNCEEATCIFKHKDDTQQGSINYCSQTPRWPHVRKCLELGCSSCSICRDRRKQIVLILPTSKATEKCCCFLFSLTANELQNSGAWHEIRKTQIRQGWMDLLGVIIVGADCTFCMVLAAFPHHPLVWEVGGCKPATTAVKCYLCPLSSSFFSQLHHISDTILTSWGL